jgi:aminoglycoside 6'-N-acetyltransferase
LNRELRADRTNDRAITFRPLARTDLPSVSRWLSTPHVKRWWPDPSDLASLERKYGPRIDGDVPTEMFVIEVERQSVGVIQRYRTHDHPEWERALNATGADLGRCSAGIDYLIGEAELVGRGIGTRAIEAFIKQLFSDYDDIDTVAVAVQQANARSWWALEKAGFIRVWEGMLDSDDASDAGPSFVYRRTRPR